MLGAIIQARMTSTRLPGKVLMPVFESMSMLEAVIHRIHSCDEINLVIVATTLNSTDDPVVKLCHNLENKYGKLRVFRGSEYNVLSRFCFAAHKFHLDHIIRITSDCPLIQPDILKAMIAQYFESECDYLSNTLCRSYPRGLDAEIFAAKLLDRAYSDNNLTTAETEHVTPYINCRPEVFQLENWSQKQDYSHYRLTVDTQEDLNLVRLIYLTLYPKNPLFTQDEIIKLLKERPEWVMLNAEIEQKTYTNHGITKA